MGALTILTCDLSVMVPYLGLLSSLELEDNLLLVVHTLFELVLCQCEPLLQN